MKNLANWIVTKIEGRIERLFDGIWNYSGNVTFDGDLDIEFFISIQELRDLAENLEVLETEANFKAKVDYVNNKIDRIWDAMLVQNCKGA